MTPWEPLFETHGLPTSSDASKIRYLSALLRLKNKEIRDLRKLIRTLGLERELEKIQTADEIDALIRSRELLAQRGLNPALVKRKRWWHFWRKCG